MALEAFDGLIWGVPVDLFKGLPLNSASAWHHGKIKRNQPRPQKTKLFILGSNFQTIVRKYKHHGTTQLSYCSGRRLVLSPRDERTLVRKVEINPRTTTKDLLKMLEDITWKAARQGRSHCSKTAIKKQDCGLQLHIGTKIVIFGEMSSGLMKQK